MALGLVLVIEGVAYALVPGVLKAAMRAGQATPEAFLRLGGLMAVALGVLIVALARG